MCSTEMCFTFIFLFKHNSATSCMRFSERRSRAISTYGQSAECLHRQKMRWI